MNRNGTRRSAAILFALALGLAAATSLAGCARELPGEPEPPAPAMPTDGELLTTDYPVTVLDSTGGDGEGAQVCFGAVAESYPPQCSGPALIGWNWDEHEGEFETASGVRWGEFVLTGRYDAQANTFTPTEVRSAADFEWPEATPVEERLATPCPEPEGGWRVLDEAKTNGASMEAAFAAARALDGYSAAWMDQPVNPASSSGMTLEDAERLERLNDPALTIVNVRVIGDVAAAEAELRKVWGGMLCVTKGERTEAELLAMQEEIHAEHRDLLGSASYIGEYVEIQVIHDDGGLQGEFDERYGPGAVRVDSVLRPADSAE